MSFSELTERHFSFDLARLLSAWSTSNLAYQNESMLPHCWTAAPCHNCMLVFRQRVLRKCDNWYSIYYTPSVYVLTERYELVRIKTIKTPSQNEHFRGNQYQVGERNLESRNVHTHSCQNTKVRWGLEKMDLRA